MLALAVLLAAASAHTRAQALVPRGTAGMQCDPVLTALFTPPRPRLGRYEVCTTSRPLLEVAPPDWPVEALLPGDAFGDAGPYDRSRLVRLYGGNRVRVSRGWRPRGELIDSETYISPYPDTGFTALNAGTLLIRYSLPASSVADPVPSVVRMSIRP